MQSASPGQTPGVSTRLRCCWHTGLAEPHNTGLRRGAGLRNFVDALPFEPTLPFEKLSGVAATGRQVVLRGAATGRDPIGPLTRPSSWAAEDAAGWSR